MEYINEIFDSEDIQISEPFNEMKNRIDCFLKRKREAKNRSNTRMYSYQISDGNYVDSSRTCSIIEIKRQKESECFVKKIKVHNTSGPLLNNVGDQDIEKNFNATSNSIPVEQKSDVRERISNLEKCLSIKSNEHINIYEKLKSIEDHVLRLESMLVNNAGNKSNIFPSVQLKEIVNPNTIINDLNLKEELQEDKKLVISNGIPKKSKYTADEIQNIINDIKKPKRNEKKEFYFEFEY